MDMMKMFRKEEDHTLDYAVFLLTGLGLGAGLMYLFDPAVGRRRRSMIAGQASNLAGRAGEGLGSAWDATAEGAGSAWNATTEGVSAAGDRVGDAFGNVADRAKGLVQGAASMFSGGGQGQSNQQGRGASEGSLQLSQQPMSPTTRMVVGTAGGALVAYGMTQRFPVACALGTVGLGLVARAVTNFEMEKYLGLGGSPIEVHKSITIAGPVERVFPFFARYDTFPKFMAHIREVRQEANGRSHWVADGPAGIPVAWDAVETRREPNRIIAWRSEPGSIIANAGALHFTPAGNQTRVDIHMSYLPPAGALGHFAAKLFGADPKKMMDEDVERMKALVEEGQTNVPGQGTVSRQEVTGGAAVPAASGTAPAGRSTRHGT